MPIIILIACALAGVMLGSIPAYVDNHNAKCDTTASIPVTRTIESSTSVNTSQTDAGKE